jgi:DNA-binding response OmpR family regulator
MPLFRRNSSNNLEPASATPTPESPRLPHLLVCDDNESVTQLVTLMFTHESWTVEVVSNGRDCLAAMDRRSPDVVLLDYRLGEGPTGLETATIARRRRFDRPILLFSAHLDQAARTRAEQLDVIPVNKLDFAAVVRHVNVAHRAHTRRRRTAPSETARPR